MSGSDLGLVERGAHLRPRRLRLLGGVERDEVARLGEVDRAVGVARPVRAVGVDHRGRVLLQQLAADHEHGLRLLLLAGMDAVVVLAEIRRWRTGVELRDVVQLLAQRVLAQPLAVDHAADVPELAEVAAALVGRVLAPEQLARELVVEPDHVRLDELLVRLDQRDAVLRDQVDVGEEELGRDRAAAARTSAGRSAGRPSPRRRRRRSARRRRAGSRSSRSRGAGS